MNGPSAVETATKSGRPKSTATSQVAIRCGTARARRTSKTISWPSYAVGHCPVNGWLLRAAKSVVRISRVERRELRRPARCRGRSAAWPPGGRARRARGRPSCRTARRRTGRHGSRRSRSGPAAVADGTGAGSHGDRRWRARPRREQASAWPRDGRARSARLARDRPRVARFRGGTYHRDHARPAQPARSHRRRRRAPTTTRWRRSSTTCGLARRPSRVRGAGGDERSIARHRERGKLPVRERIDRLLDPGSRLPRAEPARGDRPVRRRCARAPGSSPASAGSRARPASSSPTTPRSRAAPTTR